MNDVTVDIMVEPKNWNDVKKVKGLGGRIITSILSGLGWLSFVIAWLFFYAGDYNPWQNLGVLLISALMLIAFNVVMWILFGLRYMPQEKREKHMTLRMVASALIALGLLIALIAWFLLYAGDHNIYQNIAVTLVFLSTLCGTETALWYGHDKDWTC
jgi:hydrogenase-4 membrane subunit HyfE